MKYRLVIFDFDGTLADSFPFFVSVFNQLAIKHGFNQIDPALAPMFRHYTAKQMMDYIKLPAWKLPLVAKNFITLMSQNLDNISLFENVAELLLYLKNAGVKLAIVSSNAYQNVSQVLGRENANLISHYECGMSMFGKPARIRKVLKKTGISNCDAIYIGDQVADLEAARKESVAFGAVSWGYGAIESLRNFSPEEEFDSILAIKRIA